MTRPRPITAKQRALLAFCADFFGQNDQLPTASVIAERFGWASANAAYEMLSALERHQLIQRNVLGKFKFTPAGWRLIADSSPVEKELSDERYVLADER